MTPMRTLLAAGMLALLAACASDGLDPVFDDGLYDDGIYGAAPAETAETPSR